MAGRNNTFTGPYEHDIGQGTSATISGRLLELREGDKDGYLVGTVGTASTPDPGVMPNDVTFVYRVRRTQDATYQTVASQMPAAPQQSWALRQTSASGTWWWFTSADGSNGAANLTLTGGIPVVGFDEWWAVSVTSDTGSNQTRATTKKSSDNGATWTSVQTAAGTKGVPFDTNSVLTIGGDTNGSASMKWYGRIYWVEARSGLDPLGGTLLWRFDANDYVSGTSFVSNGRTWTLTSPAAITALAPASEASQQEVIRAQAINGTYVYFRRSNGTVTQALMDDLLGPSVFPSWPSTYGFSLVYEPEWWPIEHGKLPAFQVKRPSYGTSRGGDWVRGSEVEALPNAVLKYQTDDAERRSAVAGQSLLYVQPAGYDSVRIEWDWPVEVGQTVGWQEIALVRSMFGSPTTPNDGQTVFRSLRSAWTDNAGDLVVGPVIFDNDLTAHLKPNPARTKTSSGGVWLYYTLFFNISPKAPTLGDWVIGFSDWVQLPRHFQHDEHLYNGVPPYYQWIDENNRRGDGRGFLKQFLSVFGFELDFTRQSIEFVQDMYHTDISPIPLLKEIGNNLGAVEEQGLGDIRFRAGMSNLAERLNIRGTQKGLQETIETMSKYDTDITQGKNMMLLPDDSSAQFSTGNWAGPHEAMGFSTVRRWQDVVLSVRPADSEIPDVGMTGFLRISSPVAGDLLATCGSGRVNPPVLELQEGAINQPGEYLPLTNGIPVEEKGVYAFTVYIRLSSITTVATAELLWFDGTGKPSNFISSQEGTPPPPPSGGLTPATWSRHVVQGVAPQGAMYLVPGVLIKSRPNTSAYVDITAAMVYIVQEAGTGFTVTPPDRLLTLGDPNEKIGEPPKPGDPTFTGFVIGQPLEKGGTKL